MILRARSPPPTSSAPAPRPNKEAVPATPPVLGSSLASALASALPASALASGALASALPALASALGPAAAACSMVCVHSAVVEGVTVSSLPEKSMLSVLVLYWVAPCSLATLPVWAVCCPVGHRLALLPLLLTLNDGEALPLVIRLSDSSWETGCAMAGGAATNTTGPLSPNSTNFFNFSTSFCSVFTSPRFDWGY